jgi:hypothetical protein
MRRLISGVTVYVTKRLRSDLGGLEKEASQIAAALGAQSVKKTLPSTNNKYNLDVENFLFIGSQSDPQGAYVRSLGQNLYSKDIFDEGYSEEKCGTRVSRICY